MVAQEAVAIELHLESLERMGQYPRNDCVSGRRRTEKEAALKTAVSDEVGRGWLVLEAEKTGHGDNPDKVVPKSLYRAVGADVAQKVV